MPVFVYTYSVSTSEDNGSLELSASYSMLPRTAFHIRNRLLSKIGNKVCINWVYMGDLTFIVSFLQMPPHVAAYRTLSCNQSPEN